MDTVDAPDIVLPIPGIRNIRAIDYDPIEQFLYWVDRRTRTVKRTRDNGTKVQLEQCQWDSPMDKILSIFTLLKLAYLLL